MADAAAPRLVRVAVPTPLLDALTYEVPDALAEAARPGARVRVPLGRRRVVGVVLEEGGDAPEGVALREIESVLDAPGRPAIAADLLAVARWMIDYYLAPPGDVVRAMLPAALSPSNRSWVVITPDGRHAARIPGAPEALVWLAGRPGGRARPQSFAARLECEDELDRLASSGYVEIEDDQRRARGEEPNRRVLAPSDEAARDADAALAALARRPAQRAVLRAALDGPGRSAGELLDEAGASSAAVRALVREGWLVEHFVAVAPAELPVAALPSRRPERLTEAQSNALAAIVRRLDAGEGGTSLLFGVTGSGKTEVFLRAAEHALEAGRSVLVLVPEIALTPQVSNALGERFGETVVVLHSGMSDRQRVDAWRRARDGRARVVVGARSAVFAPLENLGLVVIDEEHDGGFKQEESPRYHARDLALVRARATRAVVVLASATPSVEAWTRASSGASDLLHLPDRVGGGTLARTEIVDMREEFVETEEEDPLSRRLVAELGEALERGEQGMILLNRRGYRRALLCRSCGASIECSECSVPMTWHKVGQRLVCHYCAQRRARPESCPACGSEFLHEVGEGTQRIEELLGERLPGARVDRLDRDAARSPQRLAERLGRFARGETNVLVGTQMIAKGHHFPNVTVVGVLSADAALHLPDFRAAERAFALLTQVAGRAGRGERPGRVLIQAFRADHPALLLALEQNYERFVDIECAARRTLRFPPEAALANLVVRHAEPERALERGGELADALRRVGEGFVAVRGPAMAPLARLRGEWRAQIVVRALKRRRLVGTLREAIVATVAADGTMPRWLTVDVDPHSLL
jgi:primosomal protein N' (replication factor Y)